MINKKADSKEIEKLTLQVTDNQKNFDDRFQVIEEELQNLL
jgi:hypothetical protein